MTFLKIFKKFFECVSIFLQCAILEKDLKLPVGLIRKGSNFQSDSKKGFHGYFQQRASKARPGVIPFFKSVFNSKKYTHAADVSPPDPVLFILADDFAVLEAVRSK